MNDNNTSVEPTRVNRLSDHEFLLALAYINQQGQTEYGFPPYDWELKFYTSSPLNFFTVSFRGGVMLNCRREGDMVRVIMDGHKLSTGVLRARSTIYIPDSNFPDGTRRVVDEHEFKTLFVSGHGTLASGPQLELLFPYVKGDPGKAFTYDDFTPEQLEGLRGPQGKSLTYDDLTPEQIEGLRGPQGEPFTYDDFTPEQLEGLRGPQGNSLTYDDLTPGQIAELQRPATEAAQRVSSAIDAATATNNAITKAEQTRVEAEQTRVEAEQERAREFAGFEQDFDKASKQYFIGLWNTEAGKYGCYNEATGFFELNGITDIPYAEAMEIYRYSGLVTLSRSPRLNSSRMIVGNAPCRTLLPLRMLTPTVYISELYQHCQAEILRITHTTSFWASDMYSTFAYCTKLRRIEDVICYDSEFSTTFYHCYALEYLRLARIKYSVNLSDCSKLSRDSVAYIVANADNTKVITVTVHPDVYAKLTGDTTNAAAAALSADELAQWQEVLGQAVAKNISFATT